MSPGLYMSEQNRCLYKKTIEVKRRLEAHTAKEELQSASVNVSGMGVWAEHDYRMVTGTPVTFQPPFPRLTKQGNPNSTFQQSGGPTCNSTQCKLDVQYRMS